MDLTKEQKQQMVDTMTPEHIKEWVQEKALYIWGTVKRGTIEAATGVGKTRIGLMALDKQFKSDKDSLAYIVVPTETLRDVDWPDEMDAWGYGWMKDHPNIRRVCHVSLSKEVPERDVDLIVLDEVHHMTPISFTFFNRDYKVFGILGLTATLPLPKFDVDRDKLAIINKICPSVFKVTIEEAIELRLVSDFIVTACTIDLDSTDRYIEVGTGAKKETRTEASHYKKLSSNVAKAMWMVKLAGVKFKFIQERADFIRNLRSKERVAKEIMGHVMAGKRTLIFCGSIKQCEKLCGENVYNSDTNDVALEAFCNEEISYLGVVDALNEGKNVPNLDQIIIVQGSSKALKAIQRIGRSIRFREGHVALVIILIAKNTVDEKWYRSAFKDFAKSRITEHHVKL